MEKTPEISPTFCISPWMETTITSYSFLSLCSVAQPTKDEKGRNYNILEDRLEDYWNSYSLREVRRKMLHGETVETCHRCYFDESIKKLSRRQFFNFEWLETEKYGKYKKEILERVEKSRTNGYRVEKQPLRLDIRPGNLCNLKCRICSPRSSSKIAQEQKKMLNADHRDPYYFKIKKQNKRFFEWHKNKELWEMIHKWVPGIKSLHFTGGEPTLIKENWDLIDYLKKKGYSKDVNLEIITNCTQAPDKLIATFEDFRFVEIKFSVDGYKEVNEYIRYPSKWEEVERNIIKILKNRKGNTLFHVNIVGQAYNVLDLPRTLKWIDKLKTNYGYIVSYTTTYIGGLLDINILPKNVKEVALLKIKEYENSREKDDYQDIDSVKNVLKGKEKTGIEKDLKKFYGYTKLLDQHRGNSFEKTFPELNSLLDEDGRWKS